jgi:Bacteriocin-protection, YdeI or OmpD-Associated
MTTPSRTLQATIVREGSMCFIRLPKPVFGKVRAGEHVEAVEGAKKPETRVRRIAKAVRDLEVKGQ